MSHAARREDREDTDEPRGTLPRASVVVGVALAATALAVTPVVSGSAWAFLHDREVRALLLLAGAAATFFLPSRTPPVFLCVAAMIAAQLYLANGLISATGGHLLFSDDHSAFFYRLYLLHERFPDLAFYNPGWNGGTLVRELFMTGAVLLHLVALPLYPWMPLERAYDVTVAATVIVVLPWAVYAAARLLDPDVRLALVAAWLALAPSLLLYRWALAYGAVPFVASAYLTPLIYALALRAIRAERADWRFLLALAASLNLAMFWSGSAFMLAPVGVALLLEPRSGDRARAIARLAGTAVVVLVLNYWWIEEYLRLVPIAEFLKRGLHGSAAAQQAFSIEGSARLAWSIFIMTDAVLWVLVVTAAVARSAGGDLLRFVLLAMVYLGLAVFGPQLKRHLELDRMALPMALCLALPAAAGARALWRSSRVGLAGAAGRGVLAALLAASLFAGRSFYRNEGIERFRALDENVEGLVRAVRRNTRGGRTYISGFVLHDFADGHASGLQRLTGVPMVAVDPVHRYWWYQEPLPPRFRQGAAGLHEYLRLFNVDLAITKDRDWRLRLSADPAFEEIWAGGQYKLFRFREFPASYFQSGSGEVEASLNRLRVRLDSGEAVLRFRWVDGLEISAGGSLEPARVKGIELIHVRGPSGRWLEVSFP
ncbi:MAG: hypothetical protein QOD06_2979 [Candidatus Binatota bacterium]|nr:hypothetical protein [Candidatus Binatota bacterium]